MNFYKSYNYELYTYDLESFEEVNVVNYATKIKDEIKQ